MTIHEGGLPTSQTFLSTSRPGARSRSVTVTVVIPLHNGVEFIEQAIKSVLHQTEQPEEIIIVDDGSIDEGPRIIESLALKYPIKLISQANKGQSAARNT